MTGDTKKNVENKGAATEQVALNKWCHPMTHVAEGGRRRPVGHKEELYCGKAELWLSPFLRRSRASAEEKDCGDSLVTLGDIR